MAKLAAKHIKRVEEAEEPRDGFLIWPNGWYTMELSQVEEEKTEEWGFDQWNIQWTGGVSPEGEDMPGRQFDRLTLPASKMPKGWLPRKMKDKNVDASDLSEEQEAERDKAWDNFQTLCAGRVKQFFRALGYTPDSDTDEMIGDRALVHVGVQKQLRGRNAGNDQNYIRAYKPVDAADDEDDEDTGF